MSHFLFLNASTREPGHIGNTETLARRAAAALPAGTQQTWCKLADLELPPFVDLRHTAGTYPMPMADAAQSGMPATVAAVKAAAPMSAAVT